MVEWLVPLCPPPTSRQLRFIDCTVGSGGHAETLLVASAPSGRLLGLDADPEAVAAAAERLARFGERVVLARGNFRELAAIAAAHEFRSVDGVLMDLGLSSRQLEGSGRGFSFRLDEPLDMRFDPQRGPTAADVLNTGDERDLADLIFAFGEERRSRRIAREIVRRRGQQPFATTADLVAAVKAAVGRPPGRIHPATRTFQALRIAVNRELESLEAALPQAAEQLTPGGRLAVISFHSLEDRLIKQFFRAGGLPRAPLAELTRRPVTPRQDELAANPRARSAKLRVAERTEVGGAAS